MTAICPSAAPRVSAADLLALLSADEPAHDCLGGGLREALELLAFSRGFYELPPAIEPELAAFELHCRQALLALQQASLKVKG